MLAALVHPECLGGVSHRRIRIRAHEDLIARFPERPQGDDLARNQRRRRIFTVPQVYLGPALQRAYQDVREPFSAVLEPRTLLLGEEGAPGDGVGDGGGTAGTGRVALSAALARAAQNPRRYAPSPLTHERRWRNWNRGLPAAPIVSVATPAVWHPIRLPDWPALPPQPWLAYSRSNRTRAGGVTSGA